MGKTETEKQTGDRSDKNSTDALAEVLSFARQALENLYDARNPGATGNDLARIEQLRKENKLLKKELSELEKMIKGRL